MRPLILLCAIVSSLSAQVADDFSDNNLSLNPTWVGDTNQFIVNSAQELQSNGPAANETLSVAVSIPTTGITEWSFRFRLEFSPSNANFARVYLVSNNNNLESSVNGYYLKLGGETGNNDALELYRQDGNSHSLLWRGVNGTLAASVNKGHIRVTRSATAEWNIYADSTNGTDFQFLGRALDGRHTIGGWFGFYCVHTSTRRDKFFFDDVYIGAWRRDTTPPQVQLVNVLSNRVLELVMSENLVNTAAINTNFILLPVNVNPIAINTDATIRRLTLTFDTSFISGNTYQLLLRNLKDLQGNTAPDTVISFNYTSAVGFIIISELMVDPEPAVGLPVSEYIELYNPSEQAVNLNGWRISDNVGSTVLSNYILAGNSYVIICPASNISLFRGVNVLGLNNFPGLNNSGDSLILIDPDNKVIQSIIYKTSWYKDSNKDGGGWSLERQGSIIRCAESVFWAASNDPLGGTPGRPNSVIINDTIAPKLINVSLKGVDSVLIAFNEPIDTTNVINQIVITPAVSIQRILITGTEPTNIIITLSNPIDTLVSYKIEIINVKDCYGNSTVVSDYFGRPIPANSLDILITEIMADPNPAVGLPVAEYIEIYNNTNRGINLSGWKIADINSSSTISSSFIPAGKYAIICDAENTALFRQRFPQIQVISVGNFISLNDVGDSLRLLDVNDKEIYSIYYSKDWYKDERKQTGGWSLEAIDISLVCLGEKNWAASVNALGGTPGMPNSLPLSTILNDTTLKYTLSVVSSQALFVCFDRRIDSFSVVNATVVLNPGEVNVSLSPVNNNPFCIWVSCSAPLDSNTSYFLKINGLKDCKGVSLSAVDLSVALPVQPLSNDIIINEILFNPRSGSKRFIELYNKSTKIINLKDLAIARGFINRDSLYSFVKISASDYLFYPLSYICITEDSNEIESIFRPIRERKFFQINRSLPAFDHKEDVCLLLRIDSLRIDSLHYFDSWHFPDLDSKKGVALERLSFELPTNNKSNWFSAASTYYFGTPGYANSHRYINSYPDRGVKVNPSTFSPDGDGFDDLLMIEYKFSEIGSKAKIIIYDVEGRPVKTVESNALLPTDAGILSWDGTDDWGKKLPIGIYLVYFERIEPITGKIEIFRIGCVLAGKL